MAGSQSSWTFRRDNSLGAPFSQPSAQRFATIAFITDEFARRRHGGDTLYGNTHIVNISGRYEQNQRPAFQIADGVDLGVSATPCLADTIGQGPPFAPPAVR